MLDSTWGPGLRDRQDANGAFLPHLEACRCACVAADKLRKLAYSRDIVQIHLATTAGSMLHGTATAEVERFNSTLTPDAPKALVPHLSLSFAGYPATEKLTERRALSLPPAGEPSVNARRFEGDESGEGDLFDGATWREYVARTAVDRGFATTEKADGAFLDAGVFDVVVEGESMLHARRTEITKNLPAPAPNTYLNSASEQHHQTRKRPRSRPPVLATRVPVVSAAVPAQGV